MGCTMCRAVDTRPTEPAAQAYRTPVRGGAGWSSPAAGPPAVYTNAPYGQPQAQPTANAAGAHSGGSPASAASGQWRRTASRVSVASSDGPMMLICADCFTEIDQCAENSRCAVTGKFHC